MFDCFIPDGCLDGCELGFPTGWREGCEDGCLVMKAIYIIGTQDIERVRGSRNNQSIHTYLEG